MSVSTTPRLLRSIRGAAVALMCSLFVLSPTTASAAYHEGFPPIRSMDLDPRFRLSDCYKEMVHPSVFEYFGTSRKRSMCMDFRDMQQLYRTMDTLKKEWEVDEILTVPPSNFPPEMD